jgi:hypothetical protein
MKILQILSANDWASVFENDNGTYVKTLACFALIEEDNGEQRVVGLDGGDKISIAENNDGFRWYLHKSEVNDLVLDGKDD